MARPLTLLLLPHGQSEGNALGLMQGRPDGIPLTAAWDDVALVTHGDTVRVELIR